MGAQDDHMESTDPALAAYRALRSLQAYDVSPTVRTNMPHWPSHPTAAIVDDARTIASDHHFIQVLILPEHAGSHVDAPAHIQSSMPEWTIDRYAADHLVRPFKKYDLTGLDPQPGQNITRDELVACEQAAGFRLEPGDIALLNFGWDRHYPSDDDTDAGRRTWWAANSPGLDEDACRHLADAKVTAVAADNATCDTSARDGTVNTAFGHDRYFLPNQILIIEGLVGLGPVPPVGLFVALPMKIRGGSGSPLRVVLYASTGGKRPPIGG